MAKGKYDRLSQAKLPLFGNHRQARMFLKNKHGDDFMLVDSEVIGEDDKVYFYHLVLDRNAYEKGIAAGEIADNGECDITDFLESYQSIEIFEDGRVHMVH